MWSFFSRDPTKDFPYDIGDKVSGLEDKSSWSLHDGKRKSNGEPVSVFTFDIKSSSEALSQVARGAFKRIKTLRHPNILTYLDGLETDRMLFIVTEAVVPLACHLENNDVQTPSNQLAVSWGLHQISKALWFLNNDCSLVHNNVCIASIFVDRAGDWKLGGVDYVYPVTGTDSYPPVKLIPALEKYDPPERTASTGKKPTEKWSVDAWCLGCLIWEVFNGSFQKNTSLKSLGKIPKSLVPNYCELVGANPKSRPSTLQFVESCSAPGGFMDNKFVTTMLFLEQIQIQDQEAKLQFFNGLPSVLDLFPTSFCKLKILPQLINAFEYGSAGSSVLAPLFKLGKLLDSEDYQKKVVPCVVKLFSSTDRATRVKLLQQIEMFCEHLTPAIVNDQIFPHIVHGFMDANPVVREHTIKSVVHLAPKLNYKNLNEEILKHFSRLQSRDDQGGIRTNTTVCLGKISCYLNPQIRQKVLSHAYIRALKDPFPPARQAGILAMAATHGYFTLAECAQRILPSLCVLTTDPDKGVRDQAVFIGWTYFPTLSQAYRRVQAPIICQLFKSGSHLSQEGLTGENTFRAIKCFLGKLEKVSENPELAVEAEKDVNTGGTPSSSSAGWTNWAVSSMTSLTSKIYKGQRDPDGQRSPSSSLGPPRKVNTLPSNSPSADGRQASVTSPVAPSSTPQSAATSSKAEKTTIDEAEGNGWDDDAWDDEENWGEMEATDDKPTPSANASAVAETGGSGHAGHSSGGGGWDNDGEGWDSFEDTETDQVEGIGKVSAATSFREPEFATVQDKSLQPASTYNWDKTSPVCEPSNDDFFNSLIEDKKKPSSSILKLSSSSKKSSQSESLPSGASLAAQTATSRIAAPATRTTPPKTSAQTEASKKPLPKKKAAEGWDDESWGQW